MKSQTTKQFRGLLAGLPKRIRKQARKAYELFKENSTHPGLQFKKVHATGSIYSARISIDFRAVGLLRGDRVVWFWIGSHAEYESLLKKT